MLPYPAACDKFTARSGETSARYRGVLLHQITGLLAPACFSQGKDVESRLREVRGIASFR
jgi:hypothetical protein